MRAAWVIARADIARRWKALVALAVLTGLAGAVVVACVAGARRTDTVYERLLATSRAYDAEFSVVGDLPSGLSEEELRAKIKALPMVEEAGSIMIIPADEVGRAGPFQWGRNVGAVIDAEVGRTFEKARVVAGRHPNVNDPTEAAVSEALLRGRRLSVGDTIAFQPLTFDELFAFFGGVAIRDPRPEPVEVKIVGVWRLPHDVSFSGASSELLYMTPAFARGPARELAALPLTYVRLRGGAASYDEFARQVRALAGDPDAVDVGSQQELIRTVERAVDVQALALLAFASLAGFTSVLMVGQSISRHVQQSTTSDDGLVAVGATRGTLTGARMLGVLPLAIGAVLVAAAAAVAVSSVFPIGFTRPLEPDPGTSIDVLALTSGSAAIFLFVLGRAGLASLLYARRSSADLVSRPARLPELAARAGWPASMVSGLRFATMRGKGRSSVPLISALGGTLIGVAALIAAVTFASSFDALLESPGEYGWTWDVRVGSGEDKGVAGRRGRALVQSSHTADVASIRTVATRFEGATVTVLGFEPLKGDFRFRLLDGRMPSGPSEVVMASETLRSAGKVVGDVVELERPRASCEPDERCITPMRVVGTFVMPAVEDAPTDEGALVSAEALPSIASTEGFTDFLVNLAPDSTPASLAPITADTNLEVGPGRPSVEIENLSRVRSVPFALAAALGTMALATLSHLLVTSVRRRRSDLAVLKTLGFVRTQVRSTVGWLATVVILVALALGLPMGVAVGRWTWSALNTMLGLGAPASLPTIAFLVGAAGAVVLANVIAALPARSAARTHPAVVLRTE